MAPFLRPLARLVAIAAGAAALWVASDRVAYDPAPWLADLAALEDSTSVGYANLEWQVAHGVTDPVALHRRTDSLIRHGKSRAKARTALRDFAAAFDDGHFRVTKPAPRVVQWIEDRVRGRRDAPPAVTAAAGQACAALGYADRRRGSNLTAHPGYSAIGDDDAPFATGLISVDSVTVGVLRIDALGVQRFGTPCEAAWPEARRHDSSGVCGAACQDALWRVASDTLLAELRHGIGRLRQAGAGALLVDLTGNGGGNDWVAPAARQFTAVPLRGHRAGAIRHPHHRGPLLESVATLRAARDSAPHDAWRAQLDTAIATAERQLAQLDARCDRRRIWTEGLAEVHCSQLATASWTTGYLPYLPPATHRLPGAGSAFTPASFTYAEGIWDGPLVLLVDHRTASASEDFVVALKDNGAAVVIGERTLGAGCGYTNGGIGFRLPHSGLDVRMPDCARIRADGTNEVDGVEPDVAAGWKESDPANVRLDKTIAAMRAAMQRE
jgi:hypothetical protein